MITNKAGLDLIYEVEGKKRALGDGRYIAYKCPAGVWTIYAGCTHGVHEGMIVTEAEGEAMFRRELAKVEAVVTRLITVDVNENEYSACCSLTYNIGEGGFAGSSVLHKLNAGDRIGAAKAFELWNKATDPKTGKLVVLPGLVRRRKLEAALFLTPVEQTAEMPQAVAPSAATPSPASVAVGTAAVTAGTSLAANPPTSSVTSLLGCDSANACSGLISSLAGIPGKFLAVFAILMLGIWGGPWIWKHLRGQP